MKTTISGLKYEDENENDLKDKQDFVKSDPENYPPNSVYKAHHNMLVSQIYFLMQITST